MNKVNNIQGLSYVNPEGIVPFENNPFEVRDDEEMRSLIESIREYGILTPLIVSRQGRRGIRSQKIICCKGAWSAGSSRILCNNDTCRNRNRSCGQ